MYKRQIGHWVGFKDLTALHNEWLRSFLCANMDQTLLAHRGSYKTTDLSLFLAPVSYTHLDVYKRQVHGGKNGGIGCIAGQKRTDFHSVLPVNGNPDVYKRQLQCC